MSLQPDQVRRLRAGITHWVRILDVVAHRLVTEGPERFDEFRTSGSLQDLDRTEFLKLTQAVYGLRVDAHMVVLSLRHIDEHLCQLKESSVLSGSEIAAAEEFWRHFNSEEIRDMRNLLEHSALYLAGRGRKMKLVKEPDDWPGLLASNGKLEKLFVFGNTYVVRTVIESAVAVARAVQKTD